MTTGFTHTPVLLQEAINMLAIKDDGTYIDTTYGRGGHTRAILEHLGPNGKLLVIDQDPQAIADAEQLAANDKRVTVRYARFDQLTELTHELNWTTQIDGILMDLGVSSPQLDDASRGFSFSSEGPLDMRMDAHQTLNAEQWVNTTEEAEIIRVLKEYGEERFAKRIARAICEKRAKAPITTTAQLSKIVTEANPRWEKYKHPATRAFQAIRIAVNDELNVLRQTLDQALEVLTVGGRLCVISFHSLEDRIVKRFIQHHERGDDIPRDIPIKHADLNIRMRRVGKAIRAGEDELQQNPRARSAVLRVAEKLQ